MITTSFEQIMDAMAHVTPVLLDSALKGTAVLAVAWLVISRMHRWSSAARHMAWLATLASLLVLPPLGRVLPAWRILPESWDVREAALVQQAVQAPRVEPVAETPQAEPVRSQPLRMPDDLAARPRGEAQSPALPTAPVAAAPAARPVSWWAWVGLAWLIGAGLLLMRLAAGLAYLWWANSRLQPCEDAGWRSTLAEVCADLGIGRRVRLLQGRGNAMPMTWGLFVPHLLVPQAGDWTPQRRRVVLLHELAHVKRWDCLAQMVAEVVCAVQWFNPLTWVASKRMQNEAERACDDLVIARGSQPAEYAEHLLQIAASQHQGYLAVAMAAIPMARASKLEGRLLAILDGKRSRRAMTLGVFILALALTAGVVVPVAMLRAADRTPAATQPDREKTRRPAKRAVSANNVGMLGRGIHVYQAEFKRWPNDLRDLVEKGLKKPYDESADYLVNPDRPQMRPGYVYVKPPPLERVDNPGREVVFYEAFDDWGDGINVGFVDGHVVFMDNQEEFRKLLGREYQKQMESLRDPRYRDLLSSGSTPSGTPSTLPTEAPAPATQPEGEFYVMGTQRPGVFSLTGRRISLAQGVAAAGGVLPESKTVQLLRPGKEGVLGVVATYSVDEAPWKDSPILQPGDVIYVSEKLLGASPVISIAGDVPRPGEYPLQAGTTLLKALVAAGLNAADADRTRVSIQRTFTNGRAWMGSGFEVVRILRGEIPDPALLPGDDVYVTVPKPDASGESAKPSTSRPASPAPASQALPQVRVYALRYAGTMDIAVPLGKVLESRLGKDSPKVVADTRTNSIIVAALPEHHAVIEEILQLVDQPGRTAPAAQTRPAVATQPDVDVEFVRIRSGDNREIVDRAQGILDALYGKHAPVVEAKPSSSTVYVTGSSEQRQIAVQVIGKLDQIAGGHALDGPFSVRAAEGTEVRMVPARGGESEEIADQAQKILDTIYGKQSPFVEGRDGYIAITGRTEHLDKAVEIIRKLEADVPPGGLSPTTQSGQSAIRGRRGDKIGSAGSQPAATQPVRDTAPEGNASLPPGYRTRADQLAKAKDHAASLRAKYEMYEKEGTEKVPLNSSMVAAVESDPQVASLERQRTELVEARRSLIERFGERHRSVSDLDKRIEAVDKETVAKRLEKINEQKRMQVERIRTAMEAAEAESRRLEQASSGRGPN